MSLDLRNQLLTSVGFLRVINTHLDGKYMRFNEFSVSNEVSDIVNNHGAMSSPMPLSQYIQWLRGATVEAQAQPTKNEPIARTADLLNDTIHKHSGLKEKLASFLELKLQNHMAAYGSSDKHYSGSGQFGSLGLGLKHAHLTHNVSVVYRVHGNPPTIDIYGLYTHDESGTGNPPNTRRQKALASKIGSQQNFTLVNPELIRKK